MLSNVVKFWKDFLWCFTTLKVSKSEKQFFLKLHCPKINLNFWKISALASKMGKIKKKCRHFIIVNSKHPLISVKMSVYFFVWPILEPRAEIRQNFRSTFGQWSFKKKCFWDLLTFRNILWCVQIVVFKQCNLMGGICLVFSCPVNAKVTAIWLDENVQKPLPWGSFWLF